MAQLEKGWLIPLAIVLAAAAAAAAALPAPSVPVQRLVGQMLLVRMVGRAPSNYFLARIRQGQIGGVVLYSDNYGAAGPAHLIEQLQAAAGQGGNPPLLIAVDQEGGIVKRLPGAPTLAPPRMTSAATARAQGRATGLNLAGYGVNVDLAPVLDVGHGGFITPRTFGTTPAQVSTRGVAFLSGVLSTRVMPTAKHFPGLGYAAQTTDEDPIVVTATRAQLLTDLAPYRAAISAGAPLIMISTASYPSLGVHEPAVESPTIVRGLLRGIYGFRGVIVTDALDTPAVTSYASVPRAAIKAVNSGIDMVLAGGGSSGDADQVSTATYSALLAAVERGQIARGTLQSAYNRIVALKRQLRNS
jgi:beta-N-acetylhexosaminidase